MNKKYVLVASLVFSAWLFPSVGLTQDEITAKNWGEKTGFAPDLSLLKVPKGTLITKENVKEVADLLPEPIKMLIEKYNLTLKIRDYEPIHPSLGYIEATNKYRGKTKLLDIGNEYKKVGEEGYVAGLPFPQPKDGLEVAWNYQYNYLGDDGDTYYNVFWISAATGVEHTEEWRWFFITRTINRTDLAPIPAIKEFLDKGIQYASMTYALAPYDKKGFGALYTRSVQPLDQQGHIYVPAMRRVLRNAFGTRGDSWNGTDYLYEDIRGFMGYPEWFNWKLIGKKTILGAPHAGTKNGKGTEETNLDHKNWPHWNPKFDYEPRPVYVVEATCKIADYPYSKMVFYVDAETNAINFKIAYDKKGQLWKIILLSLNTKSKDMDKLPSDYGPFVVIDVQAEHATQTNFLKVIFNSNLDTSQFTLANLRKRGM
jgi:hypothetical protein